MGVSYKDVRESLSSRQASVFTVSGERDSGSADFVIIGVAVIVVGVAVIVVGVAVIVVVFDAAIIASGRAAAGRISFVPTWNIPHDRLSIFLA